MTDSEKKTAHMKVNLTVTSIIRYNIVSKKFVTAAAEFRDSLKQ